MTAFLFLVILLLIVWIARHASRLRRSDALQAELTARVFRLEQQIAQLRGAEPATPRGDIPAREPAPSPLPPSLEPRRFSLRSLLNLEETLGTNWLNKLGIIILVIGVAFFLAYEVRELGPFGKVLAGYAVCAAMLGSGLFFERREQWRLLARAGIAGGWALLYFTTYALYHVAATRVLSSEALDFLLLFVVASAMLLHTLRYASQVVTGLAFLLAFTTINISHGNANSLIASALLAAGLAAVALRRSWFELEIAGMAAAYLNHYLWLRPIVQMHHQDAFPGFAASAALLCAYWLIFRASYVLRRVETHRGEQLSTVAAVLNPALLLCLMRYQSADPELAFGFLLVLGALEFILGQLPITRRRRAAFIVLTTLGSCLLAAAFPLRFSGGTLSTVWLAEAEALLLAGIFLKEIVFRSLGLAAAFVVWIQMVAIDGPRILAERGTQPHAIPHAGIGVLFGFAALLFFLDGEYLPRRFPWLKQRELERLSFAALGHLAAILAALLIWYELDADLVVLAWAGLVFLLTAFARWTGWRIFLDQALLIAFGVLVRGVFHNLYRGSPALFPHSRVVLLGGSIGLLLLTLPFAFALRQTTAPAPGRSRLLLILAALDRRPEQVFFFIAFVLCTLLLAIEMRSGLVTLAWGLQAFATFALALWVKERSYRLAALALLLLCVLKIVFRDVWGLAPRDRYLTFIVLGSALLAVSYLYTRYRQVFRHYL